MKKTMLSLSLFLVFTLAETAAAKDAYEVWAIDQSNSPGLAYGGTLYIDVDDQTNQNRRVYVHDQQRAPAWGTDDSPHLYHRRNLRPQAGRSGSSLLETS